MTDTGSKKLYSIGDHVVSTFNGRMLCHECNISVAIPEQIEDANNRTMAAYMFLASTFFCGNDCHSSTEMRGATNPSHGGINGGSNLQGAMSRSSNIMTASNIQFNDTTSKTVDVSVKIGPVDQ